MVRVAILCGKQKFEIMIHRIDKSDNLGLWFSGLFHPPKPYLDAVASCRTVLMKVVVARVCVRSRR